MVARYRLLIFYDLGENKMNSLYSFDKMNKKYNFVLDPSRH